MAAGGAAPPSRSGTAHRSASSRPAGPGKKKFRWRSCGMNNPIGPQTRTEEQIPASLNSGHDIRFLFTVRFSLRLLFGDARIFRTWNALFRGSDGKFDRTPSLAAIHDDASAEGPGKWDGRRDRTARTNAGRQFPRPLLFD